ncbi:hypothetical protein [Sulfuricurvum sp.]|uniref:hypothetical protein n=1 Tax=Sulfuricurvum sp. TaxID=2025608 RepID=UPI00262B7607|nr:hypothetical protein [Sulfuricurvum sp.]MDD4950724.1 hypothetical protein [Sulfuricurvum sp.]
MINKIQVKKNIIFAVMQIFVSSISLFLLYKFLIIELGIEKIGVWSIVMAFTAFLKTGDFGFTGSIVKFVSKYQARNEIMHVYKIIETSIVTITIGLSLLLMVTYPLIQMLLPLFVSKNYMSGALALLPYSLISLWLSVIGIMIVFVFDGIQRVDIRSKILMVSNVLFALLAILFVKEFGFIGLGYAQLVQAALLLIVSWLLVRRHLDIIFISL